MKPGERLTKRMQVIDITQPMGFKYSYSFKCSEAITDEDMLVDKIKDKATKISQFKYRDEMIDVHCHIMFMSEAYVWLFENNTDQEFRAKYVFDLTNLELENNTELREPHIWEICIEPGSRCIKRILRIDPRIESKYKKSYSYSLMPKLGVIPNENKEPENQ